MKKRLIFAIVFMFVLSVFAGCSKENIKTPPVPTVVTETDVSETDNTENNTENEPEKLPEETVLPEVSLSDNLFDYQFELDGKVLSLPCAYSELEALGWEYKNADTDSIPSMRATLSDVVKNGKSIIMIRVLNPYKSEKLYSQCRVGTITVDDYSFKEGEVHSFTIAGGINFSSTEQDVRAAFGEPTDLYESDFMKTLTYDEFGYSDSSLKISFLAETGKMNQIKLSNIIVEEGLEDDSAVSSNEEAKNYKAPEDIGTSYDSFAFRLFDTTYSMPAPVSYYLETGWEAVNFKVDDTMSGNDFEYGLKLRRNNQVMTIACENFSGSVCPITDCFVTELKVGKHYGEIPVVLGGDISVGSTLKDAIEAWGEPTKTSSASGYTSAEFGKYRSRVVLSVDEGTGEIITISIQKYE